MKNRLMFLLLALFCASSTMYGVKLTDSSDDENPISLKYEEIDDSKKDITDKKKLYPNNFEKGSDGYNQYEKNLKRIKNNDEEAITLKVEKDKIKHLKERPKKPTVFTIATFSLIGNAFLGCATQTLNISSDYSFILFLTANWGLQSWYESRIKKDGSKNIQQNAPKSFAHTFGIKLKPYCSSTHWYTAIPSYILASAFTRKAMDYLCKK